MSDIEKRGKMESIDNFQCANKSAECTHEKEIKPCPFCGRKVELDHEYGQYVIHQPASGDNRHGRLFMRANEWNVRPIEDALQARIAELEQQQRWIPVSERLPEDWTMVLFTNGVTRGIGQFDKDGFYDYWYEYSFNKPVTHWMPLPNPPEVK